MQKYLEEPVIREVDTENEHLVGLAMAFEVTIERLPL
jgi:hypothetical protein